MKWFILILGVLQKSQSDPSEQTGYSKSYYEHNNRSHFESRQDCYRRGNSNITKLNSTKTRLIQLVLNIFSHII